MASGFGAGLLATMGAGVPQTSIIDGAVRRDSSRRTKVSGRLPGETSCLTLVRAVPDRTSVSWRGVNHTSDGLRLLRDLRRSLLEPAGPAGAPPGQRLRTGALIELRENREQKQDPHYEVSTV